MKCIFCEKIFHNFGYDDNVLFIHLIIRPMCQFAMALKGSDYAFKARKYCLTQLKNPASQLDNWIGNWIHANNSEELETGKVSND